MNLNVVFIVNAVYIQTWKFADFFKTERQSEWIQLKWVLMEQKQSD